MSLFRSIIASAAKNVTQLFFLIILTLIAVASMMTFLSVANTLENENERISNVSRDADFSIKVDLPIRTDDDKESLINWAKVNTYAKQYKNGDEYWKAVFFNIKEMILYKYTDSTRNTVVLKKTIIFKNEDDSSQGYEQAISFTADEIGKSDKIINKDTQVNDLTKAESAIIRIIIIRARKESRKRYLFQRLNKIAGKHKFNFSYIRSFVYNWSVPDTNKSGYIRLMPEIQNSSKPYNTVITEGYSPGTYPYPQNSTFNSVGTNLNKYSICLNFGNSRKDKSECLGIVNRQVAINKSFATENDIKIGDYIIIGGIKVLVTGFGESKGVAFPAVVDLYPIPNSNITAVAWGISYESENEEGIISYMNNNRSSANDSYVFNDLNGLFEENYVFGRFIGDLPSEEKATLVTKIRASILEILSREPDSEFILLPNSKDYPFKTRVETLSLFVDSFRIMTYALLSIIIIVMIILSLLSTKNIVQQARSRLAIMKAIGYSRTSIIVSYATLPTFISVITTIGGYFLGIFLANKLLAFMNPMLLNSLPLLGLSWDVIALIILIPLSVLVISTVVMTYLLIKESTAESLKIQDNKRPSKVYKLARKKTVIAKKKSRIQSQITLSNLAKTFSLSFLMIISTSVIFVFMLLSQVFADYSENYIEGKNYTSAIYYNRPTWNSPFTRYSLNLEEEDQDLYDAAQTKRLEEILNREVLQTPNDILDIILEISLLKDGLITLKNLNKVDEVKYPEASFFGVDFSYTYIRDLICSGVLGDQFDLADKDTLTISSCIQEIFASKVPGFLKEKILSNENYPISFGRVYFDSSEEELFTWTNLSYLGKVKEESNDSSILNIKNDLVNEGDETENTSEEETSTSIEEATLLGLDYTQSKVELNDENGVDLFPILSEKVTEYENEDFIPVILNRSFAGKIQANVGDLLSTTYERKTLKNIETNKDVYGVVRGIDGKIQETYGEMKGREDGFPDGNIQRYYYPEKAAGLEEVVLAKKGTALDEGWFVPEEVLNRIRTQKLDVTLEHVPKNFKVVGITNNFDLDQNKIYTLRSEVNNLLNYDYDWFSGKYTTKIDSLDSIFSQQACLTNQYGLFTQKSFLDRSFDNPLSTCFQNLESVNLLYSTMKEIETLFTPFLYIFLSLFVLLTAITVYIINSVTFQSIKKSIIIMRAIGYRSRYIFKRLALSFWPLAILSVTMAMTGLWLISEYVLHDLLRTYIFDVPITLRWWYFVASGGVIILLFILLFFVSFIKLKKSLVSESKKK